MRVHLIFPTFCIVFFGLLAATCRDDPHEPCNFTEISKCHDDQGLDSLDLAKALVGKWKWDYILNCADVVGGSRDDSVYEGLTIEFKADGTFILNRPNSTSYFQWQLDSIPYYGRRVVEPHRGGAPPHETLWGTLRLCGDRLLSNDSYRDGLDNFFVRE